MKIYNILIVDDDLTICALLKKLLNNHGYRSIYVNSAQQARDILTYITFDIILVDHMMPNENGVEFIKSLQNSNNKIPCVMLSAVDEIENKINALSYGSQDYITKPFNSQELLLRLNNILRLHVSSNSNMVITKHFKFNLISKELSIDEEIVPLTTNEQDIMFLFASNLDQIIYKADVLNHLKKDINEKNLNTLGVTIMRLRKKLNLKYNILKTVRGKGFVINKN